MVRSKRSSVSTIQLSRAAVEVLKKKKPKGESYEAYLRRRGII